MELLEFYPDAKARYRVGSTRPYRIGLARALGIALVISPSPPCGSADHMSGVPMTVEAPCKLLEEAA